MLTDIESPFLINTVLLFNSKVLVPSTLTIKLLLLNFLKDLIIERFVALSMLILSISLFVAKPIE